MRNLRILFILVILLFNRVEAQINVANQLVIPTPVNATGTTVNALLKLPDDYATTTTRYPLLVFLHGTGESGTNLASIYNNSGSGGPAYFIANNQWPSSFVNPANGQSYKFIVLSPQAASWSTTAVQLNYVINHMLASYRIDTSRIYLTGLSAGGQGVIDYTGHNGMIPQRIPAAIVPMSAAIGVPTQATVNNTIADSVRVWGFGSETDIFGINTHIYVGGAYNGNGGSITGVGALGKFTAYAGGHCCWNNFYNPNYTSVINGTPMSIYQWLLQFTRGNGGAQVNASPFANAGPNQSITLPVNSITITGSGSDPDGTISSYQWNKIAGPISFTIMSPTQAQTVINGLVQGVYQFELRVTDNTGAAGKDTVIITVNGAPPPPGNLAPAVNAGPNQTVMLPANSTSLTGVATDPDGTISAYSWSRVSGPNMPFIVSPATANTMVTGMVQGTYVFRLTAIDNSGAVSYDDVSVTVNTASAASVFKNIIKVGAGEYFTSYLTDENKIYSIQYISGSNVFRAFPTLSNVVDVDGAQYTNIVLLGDGSVRVIKKASWGGDSVKTVPVDAYGNAFTGNSKIYGWFQAYLTIKNDSIYYWGFDYLNLNGGNQIVAPIKLTQPAGKRVAKISVSTVDADMPKRLTILTTDGTVWQYATGNPTPTQVTLPAPAIDITSIGRAGYMVATANNLYAWGPYASYFGLIDGLTTPTSVLTKWTNAGMVLPIKELKGNWNTVHIIDANDNLFGQGDNVQGEIGNGKEYPNWRTYTYNSSPAPFSWSWLRGQLMENNPVQIRGKVKNLCTSNSIAFYSFVQDVNNNWYSWGRNKEYALGNGLSVSNDAIYPNWADVPAPRSVSPSTVSWSNPIPAFDPNIILRPVANAGIDANITTNSTTLYGDYSFQQAGTITSYAWSMISGPNTASITNPATANTTVTGLITGIYVFRITVTNNSGLTDFDDITINVNTTAPPPNQAPTANAGVDQTVTLPTSSVTLTGSGTDPDGTISSYQWTKIAGPTSFTIVSPTQAQTVINSLVQGVYQFELRVTDNGGAIDRDTVVVTVNAAVPPVNQVPTANAGGNQTITLPTSSVTLTGSGTDPDGTIVAYLWTKVSGPTSFNIVSPTQFQTVVNNLVQGVYQFELRITDNLGAFGRDTVMITVNAAVPPPNQAPTANAGANQTITLPTNSITATGSGNDPDGTITAYQWTKIAGPLTFNIVSPTQAQTVINNLVQGVYQFELRVTDNSGASGRDTITVTVNAAAPPPANQAPTANAGPDLAITLPLNYLTLTGSGTDPDGTIAAYQWTKIAGPASFNISNASQAQTLIDNLEEGAYQFELRVTDNQGATGRDTVTVTVNPDPRTQSDASVFPNPATSVINIRIDAITNQAKTTIRIYDARGMILYHEQFTRTQQVMIRQVDVSKFPAGTYFIKIDVDINNSKTLKLIKQ